MTIEIDQDVVWQMQYANKPEIKKLLQSPQYQEVFRLLEDRTRDSVSFGSIKNIIAGAVAQGLTGPDASERMTAGERKKVSASIVASATTLRDRLKPLFEQESFPFEFQASFDNFALGVATEFMEKMEVEYDEDQYQTWVNSVLHLLMEGVPELLEVVINSAEWWARSERILKKPNDPNANRLFFIRTVTRVLFSHFRKPMRAATLALTSIYFNCDDIDEAALSKLAPPPKPFKMTVAGLEKQIEQLEELRDSGRVSADGTTDLLAMIRNMKKKLSQMKQKLD